MRFGNLCWIMHFGSGNQPYTVSVSAFKKKNMLKKFCRAQTDHCHKGSCGRIAVVGGSEDYSGAPYLAAMSALRTGVDLASVWCAPEASNAIKAYSPDLIVRPLWTTERLPELIAALPSVHGVVVGPGLGTSMHTTNMLAELLPVLATTAAQRGNFAVVLDACAIKFVAESFPKYRLNSSFTLTPNANEFKILCNAVLYRHGPTSSTAKEEEDVEAKLMRLSLELDCTIVLKGAIDLVSSHGSSCVGVEERGSFRRSAGQGDVFAGMVCALSTWAAMSGGGQNTGAVIAASTLMKRCARAVYEQPGGRTYIASDLLPVIGREVERFLSE